MGKAEELKQKDVVETTSTEQKKVVETTATEQKEAVETTAEGMKKIKVRQVFRDKFNKAVRYEVGQVLTFDEERAADLVKRNLAEYVVPTE